MPVIKERTREWIHVFTVGHQPVLPALAKISVEETAPDSTQRNSCILQMHATYETCEIHVTRIRPCTTNISFILSYCIASAYQLAADLTSLESSGKVKERSFEGSLQYPLVIIFPGQFFHDSASTELHETAGPYACKPLCKYIIIFEVSATRPCRHARTHAALRVSCKMVGCIVINVLHVGLR